jgi:hypothetical protein
MNVIDVYNHVFKEKLLHNLRKKRYIEMNNSLSKQFYER